uniref:Uncharacterized protein n=1 Tax=Manihot esculenta TaxID=3983 RepID=A0A2C9UDQ2_MANES
MLKETMSYTTQEPAGCIIPSMSHSLSLSAEPHTTSEIDTK